jgi:cytochrome o ubiquinol oxidase operon protein cyoD
MTTETEHSHGAEHGGLRSYLAGFVLAVVLTLIPFLMVMNKAASTTTLVIVIFSTAVVQILVHLRYFLHLRFTYEQRWNVFSFVFTAVIVLILVFGSVWIMFSLHHLLH